MVYRLVIDPTQIQGGTITLTSEQQHYLKRVLRLKEQDFFVMMDGQGKTYQAQLKGESAQLVEQLQESTELPISVTLMVALPKGNGFDDIVRCCTELGVTTMIPVISQRTLLKPSGHKVERWRKIAIEAAEQSERQIVPTIVDPISWEKALIKVAETSSDRYICVTRRKAKHLLTYLSDSPPNPIIIATGCEGGWTEEEVKQAIATGFETVSLGSRILRAITAPVVSLALIAAAIERESLA